MWLSPELEPTQLAVDRRLSLHLQQLLFRLRQSVASPSATWEKALRCGSSLNAQRALPSTCWADWENMDGLCESTRQKTGEWSMWVSGTDPPCVASANPPPVGQPYPLLPGWQLLSRPKPLPEPVPHPLVRPGPKLRLPCYIKLSHGIEELIS